MSQFLCSSLQTKNYLVTNRDMSSSHPIFWSKRKPLSEVRSSELFSWSYPPKNNICAKVLAQISAKFSNFNSNLTNGSFVNPLKVGNNPLIDEMLSTQVIRRLAPNLECGISTNSIIDMSSAISDCICDSSSTADRTAFSFDDKFCDNISINCSEDISIDSDSSNERTNKFQINDSKVIDSMQNDRQKKKKRKRRRRKKKSCSTPSAEQVSKKCFLTECRNDFISFLFDNGSDYELNEELTDTDLSSNEELSICFEQIGSELEKMCENLFVDYFLINSSQTNSDNKQNISSIGSDEIDFCPNFCSEIRPSVELKSGEEESEMTAINESIRKANEVWNKNYSDVTDGTHKAVKVNFSSTKPSVRVLRVWDFASRRARSGQWEQFARDRQRFAEKCRRIDSQIGYIFGSEHRQRAYNSRYNSQNI